MKTIDGTGLTKEARDKQMIAYTMADAFDSAWTDHEEALRRSGYKVKFSVAKAANAITHNFREIRRVVRGDRHNEQDRQVQEAVGTLGDITLAFVALLIDRCDSEDALFKMYNYMKAKFPSKVNIDLYQYERNAFGDL